MKVAMYCRIGKVQDDDILLDKQIENCRRFAKENNIRDYRIYLDKDVSGLIPFKERPMGKRLLDDVKQKDIGEVFVRDVSQLSRSVEDSLLTIKQLQDSNVKLRVMNGNNDFNVEMLELTKYVNSLSKKMRRG